MSAILRRRPLAGAALIVAGAVLVLYLLLILRQAGSGDAADLRLVALVGVLLAGLAALTAVGAIGSRPRMRRASLAMAAIGWFVLGYFALWSVGLLLIIAGILTVLALLRDREDHGKPTP